jgi:two-component system, LuxR family, response regulator FixJ
MSQGSVVHVIAEDERARKAFSALLAGEGVAVRGFRDAASFLAGMDDEDGCVIIDLQPTGETGAAPPAFSALQAKMPAIVVSPHASVSTAVRAMKSGAADYLQKPVDRDALLSSVRRALASSRMRPDRARRNQELRRCYATLSAREIAVVDAVLSGAPNRVVASRLGISSRTVEAHRSKAMAKLGARTLPDLVRIWIAIDAAAMR